VLERRGVSKRWVLELVLERREPGKQVKIVAGGKILVFREMDGDNASGCSGTSVGDICDGQL